MRWTSTTPNLGLVLAVALILATPVVAAPTSVGPANVHLGVTQVEWVPTQEFAGLQLTLSGPDGVTRLSFGAGENARFDLTSLAGEVDGVYTWELTARPLLDDTTARALAAARVASDGGDRTRPSSLPPRESLIQSGSFRVDGGAIVQPAEEDPQPAQRVVAEANRATAAVQVINQDLVVQGSLCVGLDCVSSESFGFDTIRLKENNLRIHFNDTSNSASFPSNDWRLVANDSANGGRNVFYLEDSNSGREVFSVEAGARSNSIWVDISGDVGFGTSSPALDLHVKAGDSPGLRLEQDGSSGFTPQIWDLAGNEANFFLRDVTNSSDLPFRVYPGTGDDNLVLRNGRVGIGTNDPSASLQIVGNDGATSQLIQETNGTIDTRSLLSLENNGGAGFSLENTNSGQEWRLDTGGGDFNITLIGTGEQFELDAAGNVTIPGEITTSGSCNMGCDRVFLPDYELPSIEAHAAEMFTNRYLPAVGPTPDHGNRFNLSQKTTGMLNELEKAHIYIAQLNDRLKSKETTVEELRQMNQELASRLAALEAAVQKN
jgi:hypothetical protein